GDDDCFSVGVEGTGLSHAAAASPVEGRGGTCGDCCGGKRFEERLRLGIENLVVVRVPNDVEPSIGKGGAASVKLNVRVFVGVQGAESERGEAIRRDVELQALIEVEPAAVVELHLENEAGLGADEHLPGEVVILVRPVCF